MSIVTLQVIMVCSQFGLQMKFAEGTVLTRFITRVIVI